MERQPGNSGGIVDIFLEVEISGVAVQGLHQKQRTTTAFSEDFCSKDGFEAVLVTFCCYDYGSTLLKQSKKLLQIKKIIANAPCILMLLVQFAAQQSISSIKVIKVISYQGTSGAAKKTAEVAQRKKQYLDRDEFYPVWK